MTSSGKRNIRSERPVEFHVVLACLPQVAASDLGEIRVEAIG